MLPMQPHINKVCFLIALLAISFSVNAQAPNLLNYQGVARNAVGNPLPNQTMNLRLSIHNLSAAGTVVYSETRVIKTNLGGLFSVQVGSAGTTSASGTIGGVSWLSGEKYLQVEIDPASNNNYLNLGTVQLVSVPYAFNAVTAANALTVTTNANLTGAVTSTGNLTSLAASLALTGVPTAPTAAPGTNTTQIATTEFVKAAALTGAKGAQGLAGADGAAGAQGIQGLTGATGATGTAGVAGAQGIQGLTGAAGAQGIQGLTGATGAQGIQGLTGAAGVAGAQGIQGLTGAAGAAGAQGIQGLTGAAGAAGAQGIQGIQGLTGSVANVAAISATSTANGASITSGELSLAPADATNGGIVTTGNQTFSGTKTFNNNMVTNGTLTAGAITYPNADGTSGQVLTTTGAGTLSWTTVSAAGGVTTVGSVSGSSNVKGATISGTTITLTPADATNGGIVTTGVQTIAGAKTFTSTVTTNVLGVGTNSPSASAQLEVSSTSRGFLPPRMTYAQKTAIVSPDQGLIIYCTNCGANGEVEVYNGVAWTHISGSSAAGTLPVITTTSITAITSSSAISGGNVTSNGGVAITAEGVCWSTTSGSESASGSHTSDGTVTGAFVSNITGLAPLTTYYVKAYATNSSGTSYGNELSFSTTVSTTPEVTTSTAKIWMDRNLGATQVAISTTDPASYGDLYQWGRGADGHQLRSSSTTSTQSSIDQPGNALFIVSGGDWRTSTYDNLWQGVNGTNNPCPSGYRLPTSTELQAERTSWSSNNAAGALASPLKLPMAGFRVYNSGSLDSVGSDGDYWSSTVSGAQSSALFFSSGNSGYVNHNRAFGFSIRCIKN